MLSVLVCACGDDSSPSPPAPLPPAEEHSLLGAWGGYGLVSIKFRDTTSAELLSLENEHVTGRRHFDVGQPYLKNVTPTETINEYRVDVVQFETVEGPDDKAYLEALHIVGVDYVPATLTATGSSLSVKLPDGSELSFRRGLGSEEPVPGGACEYKYKNIDGDTLIRCGDDGIQSGCQSLLVGLSGEGKFWENTTCRQLGYAYQTAPGEFRHSKEDNVEPGDHGLWGDKTGGSGAGWADGSGGSVEGAPGGGGGGGTAIASCADKWVCSEITSGDAAAYKAQCEKGGDTGSTSPCPASYQGGRPAPVPRSPRSASR